MSDYTWHPTDEYVENANVTRLARAHGLSGLGELRARSVADVRWYWDAVVRDLGLPFRSPYREVLDTSRGIEYPEWFVGGTSNVVDACLERWLADPAVADRTAVAHEAEDGTVRSLSYRELAADVERAAAGLRELGVGKGDAVALYLPMIPEAVVSVYAVARLGAVLVPLFSGFAPSAIASRIQDADAKVVIVADGTVRRRKSVTMKPALDEALASCPTVKSVVVVENVGVPVDSTDRDISWGKLLGNAGDPGPVEAMDAGEPFALAYTSGTTGKPKGAVHTHAGFLVKTASEVAYSFDLKPGGVFCWITDMGWIMGPLSIIGTHANGGTLVLYEGSPDVPDTERLWQLAQRHRVTMLGVSPTLIRTLRGRDTDVAARYDLSSVHTIGSTASRGTRTRTNGSRGTCSAAGCRSSTSPAAPRSAARSSPRIRWSRSAAVRWAVRPWVWTSTSSTTRDAPCAGNRANSCAGSRGRR